MKKIIAAFITAVLLLFCGLSHAKDGSLKLKSKVELRSWQLTSRAIKKETMISGASVKLLKGNAIVTETISDADGNFEILIPADGQFTLLIEHSEHHSKKFAINTKTTPANKNDANFKPSIDVVGILMEKPKKDMKYLGLNLPSVIMPHQSEKENKHNPYLRTNIYDGEYKLIQKFCTANKLGDIALENKNYLLAKTFYQMSIDMMDGEEYPKIQLKKAEEGLKNEKATGNSKKNKAKKSKTKTGADKEKIIAKPTKEAEYKNSRETGKSKHKIARPLGK